MKPSFPRRSSYYGGDHPRIHGITSSNESGEIITSPVRKHRRQSLPARLPRLQPEEHSSDGIRYDWSRDDTRPMSAAPAAAHKVAESSSTLDVPQHLTTGQKALYSRVAKICDIISTNPLPMRVNLVSGHGEFFDRGDPVPKHATITVSGEEDPLVKVLKLEKLMSAALSERAHRRNEQMVEFVNGALGENGVACTTEAPGSGDNNCQGKRHGNEGKESDERWWSQLCANKHLTEDENFKRARDGEPLGTVADGVEWALLENIRYLGGKHVSGMCTDAAAAAAVGDSTCSGLTRSQGDIDVLVKVARLWAGCLSWGLVSRGEWSYPGIMTRILKQDMRIPQVEILINMQATREEGGVSMKGTSPPGGNHGKGAISERRGSPEGRRWRASRSSSDCAPGGEEVMVWSSHARDLSANLANVFVEEGIEEATRKAAAATARRTELMRRCYTILRVALQDIIEGKASTCMLEGEHDAAVTESYLLWLEETAARKVGEGWAQRQRALSQVISCIKLSIKRRLRVSAAVLVWLKEHSAATSAAQVATAIGDDETTAIRADFCKLPSMSSSSSLLGADKGDGPVGGGSVPTEKEFSALKRKEAKQAQDTDTVAVILHHALYLVLPCQPFSFHFTWGRFMRFCHETGLNEHIAKYYTEDFRTGRAWLHSDSGGSWIAPAIGLDESNSSTDSGRDAASGNSNNSNSGTNGSSKHKSPNNAGNGQGSRGDSSSTSLRPVSRQVARNLVKPMHPPTHALPSPFAHALPPADGSTENVHLQQWGGALEHDEVAAGGILTQSGREGSKEVVSTLSSAEVAVANECLVSLLAVHGTTNRLATCAQVTAALKKEGFPDAKASLALLKEVHALKGKGVADRLWRKRRGAALVRARVEDSVFARLPSDIFRNVLVFIAS